MIDMGRPFSQRIRAWQETLEHLREERLQRLEALQRRRERLYGKREKQTEGKHLKREK